MKKIMLAALVPATFALAACGGATTEDETPAESTVLGDDNDAAEPVAEPIPEEEPHDESVPHDH